MPELFPESDLRMRVTKSEESPQAADNGQTTYNVTVYGKGRGRRTFRVVADAQPTLADLAHVVPVDRPSDERELREWVMVNRLFRPNELEMLRSLRDTSLQTHIEPKTTEGGDRAAVEERTPSLDSPLPSYPAKPAITVAGSPPPSEDARIPLKVVGGSDRSREKMPKEMSSLKVRRFQNRAEVEEAWLQDHVDPVPEAAHALKRSTEYDSQALPNQVEEVARATTQSRVRHFALAQVAQQTFQTTTQSGASSVRMKKEKKFLFESPAELAEYMIQLLNEQGHLCRLTGIRMQSHGEIEDEDLLCSLDRIDSSGHYERGNLQLVCRFANRWKSDSDNGTFKRLIELVRSSFAEKGSAT